VTTVFIIAASEIVRAGLKALIAGDARFTVTGSAADVAVALVVQETERASPDVILIDIESIEKTLGALQTLTDEAGGRDEASSIVVLAPDSQPSEWIAELLRLGVRGVLPHTASGGEIVAAVEAAAAGLVTLHADAAGALLSSPAQSIIESQSVPTEERMPPAERGLDALTPREVEVLGMLAEGLGNKEIAYRLSISEHTVKFHVSSIFAKLGASSRTEAVMLGVRRGLIML
jgi:DNA-binding NarL/FixJ family response regulator